MKRKKIKYKKDVKNRTGLMLFLLFTCFTLCLSVGYAALNSDLKISGEANFRVVKDIRITDVSLYETTNLGLENYTSKYSKDTITIGSDLKQVNSTISYKVKVQNSGTVSMWIDSIEETKNNDNIEYVLEGIGLKELINPGEEKEFTLKIKYKDSITILPSNTNIDTILKFNFIKPESTLAKGNNGASTSTFFNGNLKKEEIESIEFRPTLDVVENAIGSWDASLDRNGTVIASYTDADGNGLYELYIGGIGEVNAPVNSSLLFRYFTKLKKINFDKYFNTANVTSMVYMFNVCSSLVNLDLSTFDTSKVSNMIMMFRDCLSLTSLNISSFDTSNVINMSYMFSKCSSLTELDLSNFNTDKVTDMQFMFNSCKSLVNLNISSFKTSKVANMSNMFLGCSSLTELNLTNFNTSKVTNMSSMFYDCKKLTNLDVSSFDTANVTNMSWMFGDMYNLKSLDLSNFNTSKVTTMGELFYLDYALSELDISSFDTSNVTSMICMFRGVKVTKLDLSHFDTSKVTTMEMMFMGCSKLENLNLSSFDTSNVTNMHGMFYQCGMLKDLDLTSFDTSKVTAMNDMFFSTYLNMYDLSSFDFSKVTNSSNMLFNVPTSSLIYVKDNASKEFILGVRSDLTNVQIKDA